MNSRYEIQNAPGCATATAYCAIAEGKGCDRLFLIEEASLSVFIELKGSNFEDAIAQLETSQKGLKEHSKSNNVWIVCLAICKINGTAMKGKKRRVLLDYGATLIVGSKQVIYII